MRRRLCIVMLHSSVLVLVYSYVGDFLRPVYARIFLMSSLESVYSFSNFLVRVHM